MSPTNARFTAWLSEEERAGLHAVAAELNTSDNYVLRSFLRFFLGLAVSPWTRELVERRSWTLAPSNSPQSPTNEVPHFERLPDYERRPA